MIFDAYAQFEESVISSKMNEMDQEVTDDGKVKIFDCHEKHF